MGQRLVIEGSVGFNEHLIGPFVDLLVETSRRTVLFSAVARLDDVVDAERIWTGRDRSEPRNNLRQIYKKNNSIRDWRIECELHYGPAPVLSLGSFIKK